MICLIDSDKFEKQGPELTSDLEIRQLLPLVLSLESLSCENVKIPCWSSILRHGLNVQPKWTFS